MPNVNKQENPTIIDLMQRTCLPSL
uniref:Uncharacterized protein n=1 Tax=Anguilla anguilla TaxID=7936 RepID=A0A0E9SFZ4_ANGAN